MRLLFEWIKCDEHGLFDDCGINFTDDYIISYDSNTQVLTIKVNESHIPLNFYSLNGSNVVKQVTCILGKNGNGKTSLLQHLFKTDVLNMNSNLGNDLREHYPYWNTIQVYDKGDIIQIYHNQDSLKIDCEQVEFNVSKSLDERDFQTTKLFISNDQFVALNNNLTAYGYQAKAAYTPYDMHTMQFNFFNRITKLDNSILVWRNYYYLFSEHLRKNANQQHFQNILYLLFLRDILRNNKYEKFKYLKNAKIVFQSIGESDAFINTYNTYQLLTSYFGLKKIINHQINDKEIQDYAMRCGIRNVDFSLLHICAIHKFAKDSQKIEMKTISTVLATNLITEILLSLTDFKSINICDFKSYNIDELLKIFDSCLKKQDLAEENSDITLRIKGNEFNYFQTAYKSLKCLQSTILEVNKYEELEGNNLQFLDFIEQEIKAENYFILKYIWLSCGYSAGERAYLNILSDISALSYLQYFSDSALQGVNQNILLFLDEPDLYCHPTWQRQMLYELIETFELLYEKHSVHIIFATHSPLFLSDIPNSNVVLLDERKSEDHSLQTAKKKTFGANIFDLYNDEFLMESFIGKFAQHKIGEVIRKISTWSNLERFVSNEELHNAELIVDLVGEPILKNKLKSMLSKIRERY